MLSIMPIMVINHDVLKINFQISKLCNRSNHDKIAPTKQNLICRGKSAMELITNDDHEDHQVPDDYFSTNYKKLPQ